MRIDTHEIDTQARKIVPIALPRQWEYRDVTGRDYGIDMELELFKNKNGTGQLLLFQIKGTEKDIIFKDGLSSFDIPTKTLLYSEQFITPFILAICPINDDNRVFYYIWIQEYIKSVLNFDNSKWRENKTTTRIKILQANIMPGNETHLFHISHFPQRLYGACEVARNLDTIRYILDGEPASHDYEETAKKLQRILNIPGYLSDQWERGEFIRSQYLQPALLSAQLLSAQKEPNGSQIKNLPIYKSGIRFISKCTWMNEKEQVNANLRAQLSHALECVPLFYEETNYGLKNILWKEEGGHDF